MVSSPPAYGRSAAGTRRVYALNPDAFDSLREYFDHFWTQALAAFRKREESSRLATNSGWLVGHPAALPSFYSSSSEPPALVASVLTSIGAPA